ncbi:MAG: biotin/lipoyl-binding protein, partial [Niameybacter sp.]
METGIKFKQIMGRSMLIFLGIMLALTILSKTIYTFLLPVVKVQEVEKGKIETKLIVDGKVGPDEKFIEKKQFKVEAPLEGKVADCQIEEGGKVQKGEVLFTLEEEQSEASLLKKELEHTKLLLEQESLDRQKQALEVERGKTQEAYQKQQDKISQVAEDAELIALQEAIQKQEQEVNLNEALYAIGAVSQEAYETSQNKREELKRKVEQLTQVKIENLEKELEALQAKETTLVNQQMEID